jgi:two-component sensor histidine kinase
MGPQMSWKSKCAPVPLRKKGGGFRQITLRASLILVVVAALIPMTALSVVQALSDLDYTRSLLSNQLVIRALATAGRERDPIIIAERTLVTLSQNREVRAMGKGCKAGLAAGLVGNPTLLNFARSDAQGKVSCSITPFEPGLSFAGEHWWKSGITRPTFTISAPVIGSITKRQVLVGMLPIAGADDRNDGAVTVAIDYSWLRKSVATQDRIDKSIVAVVLADGKILMTNDRLILPVFNPTDAIGRVAEATAPDGNVWLYSAAPLYGRELYIIHGAPRQELLATAQAQVRINLVLPLIAILLTSLAIWYATNRLVISWLDSLRTLAGEYATGNYEGDAKRFSKAPLEIAALGESLHLMARAVEQRDQDLQEALAVKTNLTLEIHHRVKNNLQIVSSLLNLQARRVSDPVAKAALDQTRARIGALAQIHRLLYEDSSDSENGVVDIAPLLTQLCVQLRVLHRHQAGIDLVSDVSRCAAPVDTAVPLSLFAVEVITNAYRHGFDGISGGTITLSYSVLGNDARLQVSDNGTGFDELNTATSMGNQLMKGFADQLRGVLDVKSVPGAGTVVTLVYPIEPLRLAVG